MFAHMTAFAAGGTATAVSARYWRLLATDISWADPYGNAAYFQAIYEFELYTSTDASGSNVALNKTSYASTIDSSTASQANDGSSSTYWQSTGYTSVGADWWKVDLSSAYPIRSVKMKLFTRGYHAKKYKIQYSSDGNTWTDLKEISTAQATATQTFTVQ